MAGVKLSGAHSLGSRHDMGASARRACELSSRGVEVQSGRTKGAALSRAPPQLHEHERRSSSDPRRAQLAPLQSAQTGDASDWPDAAAARAARARKRCQRSFSQQGPGREQSLPS